MPGFFETLNYTSVNEDWRTEAEALEVSPEDVVLAVTGGGRPLDILASGPARVVGVDANPAQTALVALEAAALRRLAFDDYAAFLGLAPGDPRRRRAALAALIRELEPAAADYWRAHADVIAAGVLYQGRWERCFRRLSRLARLVRPRMIASLFACADLAQQRELLRDRWDGRAWRALHRVLLSRPVLRLAIGDPAFTRGDGVSFADHVYARMLASLAAVMARDNFMMHLVLRGRLGTRDLPPRLTRCGVERIRPRLGRLSLVTADVVELLAHEAPARSFSRFSLSDVPSYLDQRRFERLLEGIVRCARPGARFCIRLFLSRPAFPARLAASLVREPALEARLAHGDHALAYDFIVGRVTG